MLPVRCYTCNKVLGNLEVPLQKFVTQSLSSSSSHTHLHRQMKEVVLMPFYEIHCIRRYCCKRVLLTSVIDLNIPNDLEESRKLPSTVERLPREDDIINLLNGV